VSKIKAEVKKKAGPGNLPVKSTIKKAKVSKAKVKGKKDTDRVPATKEKKAAISKVKKEEKKSPDLNDLIVHGMSEKKALDITIIDLKNIKNSVADYFILCSANSDTQVSAISDSIEEVIHKAFKQNPWRKEGHENKEWILLDYVDVVAHIFKKDRRGFYSLEELLGDATITHVE
jgi:ribosome-associated protein